QGAELGVNRVRRRPDQIGVGEAATAGAVADQVVAQGAEVAPDVGAPGGRIAGEDGVPGNERPVVVGNAAARGVTARRGVGTDGGVVQRERAEEGVNAAA